MENNIRNSGDRTWIRWQKCDTAEQSLVKKRVKEWIGVMDCVTKRGTIHVIKFLKQRITSAGAKIRWYNQRNLQYHQNNMFRNDQKQFYKELYGKMNGQTEGPDPKESTGFWSKLWTEPVEHNRDSEWLKKVKEKLRDTPKQENIIVTAKEIKRTIEYNSTRTDRYSKAIIDFRQRRVIFNLCSYRRLSSSPSPIVAVLSFIVFYLFTLLFKF